MGKNVSPATREHQKQMRKGKFHFASGPVEHIETRRDAERLMALIPPDTRGVTARLFGDPLPGRSALDQRRALPQI